MRRREMCRLCSWSEKHASAGAGCSERKWVSQRLVSGHSRSRLAGAYRKDCWLAKRRQRAAAAGRQVWALAPVTQHVKQPTSESDPYATRNSSRSGATQPVGRLSPDVVAKDSSPKPKARPMRWNDDKAPKREDGGSLRSRPGVRHRHPRPKGALSEGGNRGVHVQKFPECQIMLQLNACRTRRSTRRRQVRYHESSPAGRQGGEGFEDRVQWVDWLGKLVWFVEFEIEMKSAGWVTLLSSGGSLLLPVARRPCPNTLTVWVNPTSPLAKAAADWPDVSPSRFEVGP